MTPNLDVDLLKTFIAIAESGSFTRAAEEVNKTQSAVSMQMKRLEELLGRSLFARDGRHSRVTADGEHFLDYARRIVKLNDEVVTAFAEPEITGVVRFGTPDDYADRFLPEILARFSRTHPLVEVDVECLSSVALVERTRRGELDLALITLGCDTADAGAEVVRAEPLVWVTSLRHRAHEQDVLPLALSQPGCQWRQLALDALDRAGRRYRIAYASSNSNAVNAAVLSGLAVGAVPEIAVRPGMRALGEEEGFPALGSFDLGLVRTQGKANHAVDALARHIDESLCRIVRPMVMAAE